MPSRANDEPRYASTAPDPFMNDPPWIHTNTGNPSADGSGVQTFRLRQSWPGIVGSGSKRWYCGGYSPFGTVGPYRVPSRTPCQGAAGTGGCIRRSPKGAAAYGTPR